ncbi:MAG: type ISP restriction/modification enzyme, partial [candidate division Zixibacteria bacterium]|nr:type ISP restriction/modification enzyme [candidate division Zixibacteria bacterium]
MMQKNLGILIKRQNKRTPFSYAFVSDLIVESCVFESAFANNTICPLYLYPEKDGPYKGPSGSIMMLFEPQADYEARKSNLSPAIVERLTKDFNKTPSPEKVFFYIYAVLYSNIYRTKYAEFLKIDFPRIPFTKDYILFSNMAEYGKRLVDLHLLNSAEIDSPIARFQGKGENKVEKVRYENSKVFINKEQYFEGMTPEIWQYQIGGYQVCEKWLKDRKGRKLSLDDIKHYCKIVTSLQKTVEIQKAIDEIYLKVEEKT